MSADTPEQTVQEQTPGASAAPGEGSPPEEQAPTAVVGDGDVAGDGDAAEIEGDLDVRNFLGISDGARPGFTEIRAKACVKAPGTSEQKLKELCTYVQDTSPVKDALANPVPVTTTLEVIG